jgi:hypothetical protein
MEIKKSKQILQGANGGKVTLPHIKDFLSTKQRFVDSMVVKSARQFILDGVAMDDEQFLKQLLNIGSSDAVLREALHELCDSDAGRERVIELLIAYIKKDSK